MIKYIINLFIKDKDNVGDAKVRESYCVLGGILGVICNLILFTIKIFIGSIMGSIAIISDAFNNLSDTGSSLVSVIGAKLSNKKPDKEHPFGHGRFEYISSLIVSFIIILVGVELFKTAGVKIFNPETVDFSPVMIIVLTLSVLIKVWMYSYNKYMGKRINSSILIATAKDSLNDVISTMAVIITTVVAKFISVMWLDGVVGVVVSLIIIKSGIDIARDTIGMLLGAPPEKETVDKLKEIICSGENIIGVHDLIVHDYGPGRVMASAHAEVPDNCDIVKIHEIIDDLEKKIEDETGIHMVIHMDPIAVDCVRTAEVKSRVVDIVKSIDNSLNIHDFRMTDGENNINLIFDVEIPMDCKNAEQIVNKIKEKLSDTDSRYNSVITLDRVY